MGEQIGGAIAALVGVATLALIVSQAANTANVVSAFFGGLSNVLGVAVSPVTGQSVSGLSAAGLPGGSWQTGGGYSTVASAANTGYSPYGGVSIGTPGFGLSVGAGTLNSLASGVGGLFGAGSSGTVDSGSFS